MAYWSSHSVNMAEKKGGAVNEGGGKKFVATPMKELKKIHRYVLHGKRIL